jgi:glycosyltransferase involved in cell wall biosynthesis
VLSQTFLDFELVISDNASTDSTSLICQEYKKNDKRIRYIRNEKNIGGIANFKLLLDESKTEYFVWLAADDYWDPTFLEKNLPVLEKNLNIICSASQVKYFGNNIDYWKKRSVHGPFRIFRKIIKRFQNLQNYPTSGTFESKFRYYLKLRGHHHILFGMYRTEQLKKIFVTDISNFDLAIMLNALRFGDFYVIDDVLMHRYDGGVSSQGFFAWKESQKLSLLKSLSLQRPFTKWCFRNFGYALCLKNLDLFIIWNLEPLFFLIVNIIRKMDND